MNRIITTIMERDNISREEAKRLFIAAQDDFYNRVTDGELDCADEILMDHFGLEPDYIDDLI